VREALGLGTTGEVATNRTDGIHYDLNPGTGKSTVGFGHPEFGGTEKVVAISIGSGG